MSRIYIGNLPHDIRERDVEDLFYKYGRIRDILVKCPPRPPAYAFIDFEDPRDAEDAIRGRDGYDFEGQRLRVEAAQPRRNRDDDRGGGGGRRDSYDRRDGRDRGSSRGGGWGNGGGGDHRSGGNDFRGGRGSQRRGDFRIEVSGLDERTSWQDLKDHMRQAGNVMYVKTDRYAGTGIVEFESKEGMQKALDTLDGTSVSSKFNDTSCTIKLSREAGADDRSRSRSRGRGRSRSRSQSPSSNNRGRSSPEKDRSKSPMNSHNQRSKSRSRSPTPQKRSLSQSPRKSPQKTSSDTMDVAPVDAAALDQNEEDPKESPEKSEDNAAATATVGDEVDYASWKVTDLKEELKQRGLSDKGKKAELVERLEEAK